jgi:hypothetical protein
MFIKIMLLIACIIFANASGYLLEGKDQNKNMSWMLLFLSGFFGAALILN